MIQLIAPGNRQIDIASLYPNIYSSTELNTADIKKVWGVLRKAYL